MSDDSWERKTRDLFIEGSAYLAVLIEDGEVSTLLSCHREWHRKWIEYEAEQKVRIEEAKHGND